MIHFLKEYFGYLNEYVYTKVLMYLVFLIIPGIFTLTIFIFFDTNQIHFFFKNSSQEIINFFALTSGFLFTGISLIISTNNINNKDKERIELKNALLYDIIFQFGLTIIVVVIVTILKGISVSYFSIPLMGIILFCSVILGFSIFRLLRNFFFFQKSITN